MVMKITSLIVHNVAWAEAYSTPSGIFFPSRRVATTDMGQKLCALGQHQNGLSAEQSVFQTVHPEGKVR